MKRGKKYIEASKLIERGNLYDKEEAIALVKKSATAKFDETIEVHIRTGRSVVRSYFRTEQVKRFVSLYSLRMLRQKRQRQPERIM